MAIPIIADGDWEQEIETPGGIREMEPDTVVQGHGEVILRGEVKTVMDEYINYLALHPQGSRGRPQERARP